MENIKNFGGSDTLKVEGGPSNEYQDVNLSALGNTPPEEANAFHGTGAIPESMQQFSPNVNANPMLRQAYSMPPAGAGQRPSDQGSPNRKYNMASDIFGTGMDKSWSGESPPKQGLPANLAANRTEPVSFKITQQPNSNSTPVDDNANSSSATRKARESTGNPLTGQGYDSDNSKTAKRYFEGSNANQKLW